MAVQEQTGFDESTATGLTGVFPYTFKILRLEDMRIEIDGVVVDGLGDYTYTVSGIGEDAGGNVTITPNPPAGAIVLRALDAKLDRQTNYQYAGDLKSPVVNADFDRLWLAMQMIKRRALLLPITEIGDNVLAADPAGRAGKALIFDEEGRPIASSEDWIEMAANAAAAIDAKNTAVQAAAEAEQSANRVDLGALDDAVDATAADRVATGEDRAATAADRVATGADRAATESALYQLLATRGIFGSTADALSNGVNQLSITGNGSGGTNGSGFRGTFTGGGGSAAEFSFTVSAGAIVPSSVVITSTGKNYTSAPTGIDVSASAGLTGVTFTAGIGPNVSVGEFFAVLVSGSTDEHIWYRVDSGPVATEIVRGPSSAFVEALRGELSVTSYIGQSAMPIDVNAGAGGSATYVLDSVLAAESYILNSVDIHLINAAAVVFSAWSLIGSVYTRLRTVSVAVASGYSNVPVAMPVNAGEYLGISLATSAIATGTTAGNGNNTPCYSTTAGVSSFTRDAVNSGTRLAVKFNTQKMARIDGIESLLESQLSASSGIGYPTLPIPAPPFGAAISSGVFVFSTPAPNDSVKINTLSLYAITGGDIAVSVWSRSGDVFTRLYRTTVTVVSGYQQVAVDIPISEGQYVGVSGQTIVGLYAGSTLTTWYSSSSATIAQFTDTTTSSQSIFFQFGILSRNRIDVIEGELASISGAIETLDGSIINTRFKGRKVYHFGDSLTAGATYGSYVPYVTALLGCISTNYGSSGAATARLFGLMTSLPPRDGTADTATPNYTDVAAVTILIGTNGGSGVTGTIADIPAFSSVNLPYVNGLGATISTIEDHINQFANTFYGNLGAVIEYVRYQNPETLIYLITPPQSDRTYTNPNFYAAMKEIADYYAIRVIDARAESGITRKDIMRYSYDGTHFLVLGNTLLGNYIGNKILFS